MSRRQEVRDQRESAIYIIAGRGKGKGPDELAKVKTMMNSYYRLVGLYEKSYMADNDERVSDRDRDKLSDRCIKWTNRLNKQFNEYNLEIIQSSCLPTIVEKGTTHSAGVEFYYD